MVSRDAERRRRPRYSRSSESLKVEDLIRAAGNHAAAPLAAVYEMLAPDDSSHNDRLLSRTGEIHLISIQSVELPQ